MSSFSGAAAGLDPGLRAAVNFRRNRERRFDAFDVAFHRLDQQEMTADVTLDFSFIVLIGLVEVEVETALQAIDLHVRFSFFLFF